MYKYYSEVETDIAHVQVLMLEYFLKLDLQYFIAVVYQ